MKKAAKLKRYNLVLPEPLYDEVQRIADDGGTTVVEVMRRFIRIGLLADRIDKNPDAALLIREAGNEQQIKFM